MVFINPKAFLYEFDDIFVSFILNEPFKNHTDHAHKLEVLKSDDTSNVFKTLL